MNDRNAKSIQNVKRKKPHDLDDIRYAGNRTLILLLEQRFMSYLPANFLL